MVALPRKSIRLQEFFTVRDTSIETIKKRFNILPKNKGQVLILREGRFLFTEEDISFMLREFNKVVLHLTLQAKR